MDRHGSQTEARVVYTIGHSNHSIEAFVELLQHHGITAVADVRSHPSSPRFPHFNREALSARLRAAEIAYVFLGEELGARPEDPDCYRDGRVDFERLEARPAFRRGIDRVLHGAASYRLALMCAEKEPLDCHRTILVARWLKALGVEIRHILYDGSVEDHRQTEKRLIDRMGFKRDLFTAATGDLDILDQAYALRARQIAYTRPRRRTA